MPRFGFKCLVGLGGERSGAGNEQPHVGGSFWGQSFVLNQARIEGRNAHHHSATGQLFKNDIGIELRQEEHAGACHQSDVAGDE